MNLAELPPLLNPYDAIYDMRYATARNIAGRVLTDDSTPRLERVAALDVAEAGRLLLARHSLRLVVWDAYSSPEVRRALRAINDDDRYVREDSNHPKGLAIDLTLARRDNSYLDMGTDFDDFSERAHVDAPGLTPTQRANRMLLAGTMRSVGFKQWPYEWWHFDYTKKVSDELAA